MTTLAEALRDWIGRSRARVGDLPMASRCSGVPESIQRLSTELYRRIAQDTLARVEVVHARYHGIGVAPIERRVLLPLDLALLEPQQPRQPPLHNLDPVALHEKLMAEHIFAVLTEAAVESLARESATRLAVMASARGNILGKLEQRRRSAHQARHSEITTEILDRVSGAQTLAGHRPPTGRARTPT